MKHNKAKKIVDKKLENAKGDKKEALEEVRKAFDKSEPFTKFPLKVKFWDTKKDEWMKTEIENTKDGTADIECKMKASKDELREFEFVSERYIPVVATGFRSKAGKMIFEGDILDDGTLVEYVDEDKGWNVEKPGKKEIEGNKWENPDLLV